MIRRKALEPIKEFAENEDIPVRSVYRMADQDLLPLMKVGEKEGFRVVTQVWKRMLEGEPIPDHLKKSSLRKDAA
jgi:hypothetical protein